MTKLTAVKWIYAILVVASFIGFLLTGDGASFFNMLLFITVSFSVILQHLILVKLDKPSG